MNLREAAYHPIDAAAQMVSTMPEPARAASHAFSIGALVGSFMGALPMILSILGSLLVVIWYGLNIYNHPVVKKWLADWKAKRATKED